MLYEITRDQYYRINGAIPQNHEFGYHDTDDNKYYYDDFVEQYYDFDLNALFTDLYAKNYDEFKASLTPKNRTNLKILRYLTPDETSIPVEHINFTTLGLIKASPQYVQGRKESTSYYADELQQDIVVKKTFSDRLVDNKLIGLDISIDWYDERDEIALTKVDFKPLNKAEAYYHIRKRRQSAIDYLIGNVSSTPLEPAINDIVSRYKTEIDLWIASGSNDFANRIINESEQPWVQYLDYVDQDGKESLFPDGMTVRQIILFQIGYNPSPSS